MRVNRVQLLGCGASMGVPVIGCNCPVCRGGVERNKRLRTSALIETDRGSFLIDPGPDFRFQALRSRLQTEGPDSLKGVLITHTHADHVAGIDDLRVFNCAQKKAMPLLLSKSSYEDFSARYSYLIAKTPLNESSSPSVKSLATTLDPCVLEPHSGSIVFEGLEIEYLTYSQGGMEVLGFRIGGLVYLTDLKEYGDNLIPFAKGADCLILSAGSLNSSPMHMSLIESIELAKLIGAKETIFIHLNHEIDYGYWEKRLPEGMSLGYDGRCVELG